MAWSTELKTSLAASVVLAVLAAGSAPWWWKYAPWEKNANALPPGVVGFSGGCDAFQIYAQNRWQPYGAVVRAAPNVNSKVEAELPGNFAVYVNGWVHSRPAYPSNTAPWNSDIWFHMADDSGWLSFPGVRAEPVQEDPTGVASFGGVPVPTSGACEGSIQ